MTGKMAVNNKIVLFFFQDTEILASVVVLHSPMLRKVLAMSENNQPILTPLCNHKSSEEEHWGSKQTE